MNDLFNWGYIEGDIEQTVVKFATNILGTVALVLISITGFGIVIMSIMKNALAGLYCVFPSFFDKVDQAHRQGKGAQAASGKKDITAVLSGLGIFFLGLVPNIKAMAGFEDDAVVNPAPFFLKAIPGLVLSVFIGVLIWMGYPAKIAEKCSEMGTRAIDLILLNVDPVAWVEAIPDKFIVYSWATDGVNDPASKLTNKIAPEAIKSVVGTITDIKKEVRQDLAYKLEADIHQWVIDTIESEAAYNYLNEDEYRYTYDVAVLAFSPELDRIQSAAATKDGKTYATKWQLSRYETGTTMEIEKYWIRITVSFTRVASSGILGSSINNRLSVPKYNWVVNGGGESLTITLPAISGYSIREKNDTGTGRVGTNQRVNIDVVDGGDTIQLLVTKAASTENLDFSKITSIYDISNLYYKVNATGVSHAIKHLVPNGSISTPQLESVVDGSDLKWEFGEDPNATKSGEVTN